jgi:plastocyanin
MKMKIGLGLVAVLAIGLWSGSAANIVGKVTLKGKPKPEIPLPLDPSCGKLHPAGSKPTTRFYVVGKDSGLADVFVSLQGLKGMSKGPSLPPAVIDQKGCEYIPYVLAVQTGQKIRVKNSDPVLHNVHPTPKAGTRNKEANKAQLPNGPDLEFVFPDAEDFLRFKCDVHPWMFTYVNVVDHPYFDVSKKDGVFKIANVPPGKYTIKAHHRKLAPVTKEVEVKDGDVTVDFVLEIK